MHIIAMKSKAISVLASSVVLGEATCRLEQLMLKS